MSDERMREALEGAVVAIEGLAGQQAMPDDFYVPLLQKVRDALSPPARRTSYEWEDEEGFRYRVVWDEAIECWASQAQEEDDYNGVALWVHRNGGPEAQAIARLAGLTKPGGEGLKPQSTTTVSEQEASQ